MTPTRIVMKGKTLDGLATQVRVEHGPRARIVSAERVTSGGIAGLFAKKYVEATVELPERGRRAARNGAQDAPGRVVTPPPAQRAFAPSPAQRVGLAALLADAEDAEEAFAQEPPPPPEPAVSTRSDAFADLMDDLAFNGVAPAAPAAAPSEAANAPHSAAPSETAFARTGGRSGVGSSRLAPALLDGPGDLVVVLGENADVLDVVQSIADGSTGPRAAIRVAGTASNGRFVAVTDRRGALDARASGVELDRATLVAVGWDATAHDVIASLGPDQIWIAVDAGRKHADTERWVTAASAGLSVAGIDVDGLAVSGVVTTSTPETVEALGLPVGWRDA